jgi:hypothetical protein
VQAGANDRPFKKHCILASLLTTITTIPPAGATLQERGRRNLQSALHKLVATTATDRLSHTHLSAVVASSSFAQHHTDAQTIVMHTHREELCNMWSV